MSAFKSRATLLLEKEYFKLKRDPIWGIYAEPFRDNMFYWEAMIHGPKDTVWEGGVFKLYLIFTEDYNRRPPDVFFQTIPFHPNVDKKSGQPCIEFLDDISQWNSQYSISYILLSLQAMLSSPVLDNAVHPEAAKLFFTRPHQYLQMAKDCVYASKRTDGGLSPFLVTPKPSAADMNHISTPPKTKAPISKALKLSFEDYHTLWNDLATSQPGKIDNEAITDLLHKSLMAGPSAEEVGRGEVSKEMHEQLGQHNTTMYGRLLVTRKGPREQMEELQETKRRLLTQLQSARQDQQENLSPASMSRRPISVGSSVKDFSYLGNQSKNLQDEPEEDAVLDLVQWTKTLPDL